MRDYDFIDFYRFTVALLVISSILLIFTIGIYTYYRQLLTEYTKIMRHFASVLLVTYIIMVINKSVHLGNAVSPGLCQFSGLLWRFRLGIITLKLIEGIEISWWLIYFGYFRFCLALFYALYFFPHDFYGSFYLEQSKVCLTFNIDS